MRTFIVLAVAAALAALAACGSPAPDDLQPDRAVPLPAVVPATWPDATNYYGEWKMRLRPLRTAMALTEEGPAIMLEATLLTDDPDVLFAGGPRASIVTPAADSARDTAWLDEDSGSGLLVPHGRTAFILLPRTLSLARPVDVEVRCRLMLVREWAMHDFGSLGPGEHDDVAALPYFLSVGCYPDVVVVTATLPRERPGDMVAADDVRRLLPHAWAAQAAEVRDARGALLEQSDGGGNQWGSSVGFESGPREHRLPIAYPVTVRLRVPAKYELKYPYFQWTGLTLPAEPGVASGPANDHLPDLPLGYRDGNASRREADAALAATDPNATTWRRIANVLLRSGAYSLRERLTDDVADGDPGAIALLRDLDSWKLADEAAFERMLAECVRDCDVHRLVVGMMNAGTETDAARIVDAITDVDPHAALRWLRLERELSRSAVFGGTESRLCRDDLLRSLDRALDAAAR
jgi:hypothetical protein